MPYLKPYNPNIIQGGGGSAPVAGSAPAGSAGPAATPPQQGSGAFVDFGKYLAANSGAASDMANRLTGGLEDEAKSAAGMGTTQAGHWQDAQGKDPVLPNWSGSNPASGSNPTGPATQMGKGNQIGDPTKNGYGGGAAWQGPYTGSPGQYGSFAPGPTQPTASKSSGPTGSQPYIPTALAPPPRQWVLDGDPDPTAANAARAKALSDLNTAAQPGGTQALGRTGDGYTAGQSAFDSQLMRGAGVGGSINSLRQKYSGLLQPIGNAPPADSGTGIVGTTTSELKAKKSTGTDW